MDWWFWLTFQERKRVDDPRYTTGQGIVLCLAVLLIVAVSIGVRIAAPRKCKCDVCTDTTCKVCQCALKENKCGDSKCPH